MPAEDPAKKHEESDEDWKLRMTVRQWEHTERLRAMSGEEFAEEFKATRERTRLEELFWADQVAAGLEDGEGESDEDRQLRRAVQQWEQTERLRAMSGEEFEEVFAAARERTRLEELFWADQVTAAEEEAWREAYEGLGD